MSTTVLGPRSARKGIQSKTVLWTIFALLTAFVALTRDRTLLDPNSFLRQRYSQVPVLMFLHGIPGVVALLLGFFQFSTKLRQRYTKAHRVLGRVYVGSMLISAPVAVIVAYRLPVPTLFTASIVQAGGWIVCTLIAIYCIRNGNVQAHREWMMRGYPFAMIFVINRTVLMIPAVAKLGVMGISTTVWTTVALAGFVPSVVIALQQLARTQKSAKLRAAAAD